MYIEICVCDYEGCEREAEHYVVGMGDACNRHYNPYVKWEPPSSSMSILLQNIYGSVVEKQLLSDLTFTKLTAKGEVSNGEVITFQIGSIKLT